jgi:hypothetical protein
MALKVLGGFALFWFVMFAPLCLSAEWVVDWHCILEEVGLAVLVGALVAAVTPRE